MKRYTHIVSGARVSVRDDKVMDSSWKPNTGSDSNSDDKKSEPSAARPTRRRA
ncbi:hypothetical protein OHA01_26345 [Micromonospora zamorensis]|uniref:hypothetical protein n=1 Tax=Micromonospora zamorensis TaxID=709883 RepID=UPI00386D833B|nr:hypothetical protein OHA01_26345 [Micromonospora zamorensis]